MYRIFMHTSSHLSEKGGGGGYTYFLGVLWDARLVKKLGLCQSEEYHNPVAVIFDSGR